jgi:hypothetical protein
MIYLFHVASIDCLETGDEICVSYLDILEPLKARSLKLSQWNHGNGFTCECVRCLASSAKEFHEAETLVLKVYKEVTILKASLYQASSSSDMHSVTAKVYEAISKAGLPRKTRLSLIEKFKSNPCAFFVKELFDMEMGFAREVEGDPEKVLRIAQQMCAFISTSGLMTDRTKLVKTLCMKAAMEFELGMYFCDA